MQFFPNSFNSIIILRTKETRLPFHGITVAMVIHSDMAVIDHSTGMCLVLAMLTLLYQAAKEV